MSHRQAVLASLLAVSLTCGGCNPKRLVTVTGTVLRGGQPIAVSPTGYVQITLQPEVNEGEQFTTRVGRCEKDGTFKIPEVPPGKYKIGVEHFDPNPQTDKFNGAYRAGDSKVIRDIDGKTPVNIDLAKFQ